MVSWGVRCLTCGQAQLIADHRARSAAGRTTRRVAVFASRHWRTDSTFQQRQLAALVDALADDNTVDGHPPTLVAFGSAPAERYVADLWEFCSWPIEQRHPDQVMRVDVLTTIDAAVIVRRDPALMVAQLAQLELCRVSVARWHA